MSGTAAAEGPRAGFHKLTGPQIQRLFEEIGTVDFPDDGGGWASAWTITFQPDGTFDSVVKTESFSFGNWRVDGDMQCVEIKGGSNDWGGPFEGCFAVYVDPENGVVAANIPELKLDRFILSDNAYGALASIASKLTPPATQAASRLAPAAVQVTSSSTPAKKYKGFRKLTGPEIQRVFVNLDSRSFPSAWGARSVWSVSFDAKGNWEGTSLARDFTAHGTAHVENGKQCIVVKGLNSDYGHQPYEGCFAVYADAENGVLAAEVSLRSGPEFAVMTTTAHLEITRAFETKTMPTSTPQVATRSSPSPPSAADQAAERDRQKIGIERRALERMRLALERERLQRRRALLERDRAGPARQGRDRTPPVIVTSTVLKTNQRHVTISGSVNDASGIAAVQIDGKEVPFNAADGRFSVKTDVAIGRGTMRVAALDGRGNWAETLVSVERKRRIPKIDFGRYHALVIGIDDYQNLPRLKTPINDATAVAETLRELYGYEVTMLTNPTRADILNAFDELRGKLGKDDNLLVYYAGHGWLDDKSGRGYWLPVNASADRRSRWFSNADLTDSLKILDAKHVMVVADSCYAGTLTRSIKVPDRSPEYLSRMASKRTRVVLSSGGLEPVIDSGGNRHSIFANELLKALRGNEGVMDGTQVFEQVRRKVILNARQTPEYSDIRFAGHEGGDFLFVRKD